MIAGDWRQKPTYVFVLCGLFGATTGCAKPEPPVYAGPQRTLAVVPAINLSGSTDFDPVVVGDIMASELTQIPGMQVVGINRVLAMMAELRMTELRGPDDALALAANLGADGILVFAITEFDPYAPPVVGIAAQLYGIETGFRAFDAVSTARSPTEKPVASIGGNNGLLAECQYVFDGSQDATAQRVRDFADRRRADQSPHGWRKFLVSQRHFIRFCCHEVAADLLNQAASGTNGLGEQVTDDGDVWP